MKRYPNAPNVRKLLGKAQIPIGQNCQGVLDDDYTRAIGDIVVTWSFVEEAMIYVLRELLGNEKDTPAQEIFRSIVSQDARISIMKRLLEESPKNATKSAQFDQILKEYGSLNKERNRIVHGLWWTNLEDNSIWLAKPSSSQIEQALTRKRVRLEDLSKLCRRMRALQSQIIDTIIFRRQEINP